MGQDSSDPHVGMGVPGEGRSAMLEEMTAAWRETTDALHETERRYRELVEYSLGLICSHDLDGLILSINPAAANSLGYRPEDGIGRNLREFLAPDKQHLFGAYLQRLRTHGHDSGLMRVVARSGDERVWMYRNVLSHGADGSVNVLGHAIDVTERVAAERTLRKSEQALQIARAELEDRVKERTIALEQANERLRIEIAEREQAERSNARALIAQRDTLAFLADFSERLAPLVAFEDLAAVVHQLPVPFVADWTTIHVVNTDGTLRFVSGTHRDASLTAVLGSLADPGRRIDCPSPFVEAISAARLTIAPVNAPNIAALFGAGVSESAIQDLHAAAGAMLPLVSQGKVHSVLALFSQQEDRFGSADGLLIEEIARRIRLALDRIQLYREAQEANRLKDEFLSTLSHELRTPLNAIFGWTRIVQNRTVDTDTAHALEVIERNARAQLRLVDEVLDVSRIITGKMILAADPLDVAAILRTTLETVRPAILAKRIRIEEHIGPTPLVLGDIHRLQQVFWNLLSNAVKFTDADGTITVTVEDIGGAVRVEIADTGIGISAEFLPFVFDRFRQADSSGARTHGGLGLGLAIVKHIVELHGGSVAAASAGKGHGATFTMTFPVARRVQPGTTC